MAIYTVMAPPAPANGEADPMGLVFVKEGVAWPALFIAEIWLLFRRMWLVFAVYVVIGVVLTAATRETGDGLLFSYVLLARVLFFLEGNELRRWTLRRRGYQFVDVVEGRNVEEAEIRFFAGRDEPMSIPVPPAPPSPPSSVVPPPPPPPPPKLGPLVPSAEEGDVVGLFPQPQTSRP